MTTDMDEKVKTIIDSQDKNMRLFNQKVKPVSSAKKREYKKQKCLPKLKENSNIRDYIRPGKKEFKVYVDEKPLPLHVHHSTTSVKEKHVQTDHVVILDHHSSQNDPNTQLKHASSDNNQENEPANSLQNYEIKAVDNAKTDAKSSNNLHTDKALEKSPYSTPNRLTSEQQPQSSSSTLTSTPSSSKGVESGDFEEEIMRLGEESDEAYKLMMGEEIPEDYWKMLAETRREALDESLQENKELHEEVTKLKSENCILIDILSKNDSYSSILEDAITKETAAMSDDGESEDEDEDEDEAE